MGEIMLTTLQILLIAGIFWGSLAVCGLLVFGCFALVDKLAAQEVSRCKAITDKI